MMKIPCWLWHSYKNIEKTQQTIFEGVEIEETVPSNYRVCTKCDKIQVYNYDSQGGWWQDLDEVRSAVVRSKFNVRRVREKSTNT